MRIALTLNVHTLCRQGARNVSDDAGYVEYSALPHAQTLVLTPSFRMLNCWDSQPLQHAISSRVKCSPFLVVLKFENIPTFSLNSTFLELGVNIAKSVFVNVFDCAILRLYRSFYVPNLVSLALSVMEICRGPKI